MTEYDWVAITCWVPFVQYGIKHSCQTEYVPLHKHVAAIQAAEETPA